MEKVGIEPQVKRIGKYKSAGDQLLRRDMSEPQREQLTALLEDIYEGFTATIAKDRNKTIEEVTILTGCVHVQCQHAVGLLAMTDLCMICNRCMTMFVDHDAGRLLLCNRVFVNVL